MSAPSFTNRFSQLEIPEEKRRRDWSFLDLALTIPAPLPLEDEPIVALVNGRALVPVDGGEPPPADGARIILYRQERLLRALAPLEDLEAEFVRRNTKPLDREKKRLFNAAPADLLTDPTLLAEAREIIETSIPVALAPEPAKGQTIAARRPDDVAPHQGGSLLATRLVGGQRLLRIHGKLYELKTLKEYTQIFESAIEPDTLRVLQGVPDTATPSEVLALIERHLDAIHTRARSPLRNKMDTSRLVVNGVTLLPIYREESAGLFEAYRTLWQRTLALEALTRPGRKPCRAAF